jgi:hypothetical protein
MLEHHPQAAAHSALFEDAIIGRNLQALDSAFVDCNHSLVREVYKDIPRRHRSVSVAAKNIVAGFPAPIARALNLCLQRGRSALN